MKDWPWYLGGVFVAGLLGLVITRRDPLGVGVAPIGPAPAPPSDPPGAPHWVEIVAPFRLFNGDVYRGSADIPFGAGFLVTPSRIVAEATKMGFTNVTATSDAPADWPSKDDADRYIEATWSLEDRIVAGDSHITHAWRKTRA